jgi:predicted AAA+ superfamily ATPase
LSLWRNGDYEIDLLVRKSDNTGIAVEIKSGQVKDLSETLLKRFRNDFPKIEIIIASLQDVTPRRLESGTLVLPWKMVLEKIKDF